MKVNTTNFSKLLKECTDKGDAEVEIVKHLQEFIADDKMRESELIFRMRKSTIFDKELLCSLTQAHGFDLEAVMLSEMFELTWFKSKLRMNAKEMLLKIDLVSDTPALQEHVEKEKKEKFSGAKSFDSIRCPSEIHVVLEPQAQSDYTLDVLDDL